MAAPCARKVLTDCCMASTIPSGLYVTQAFGARPCRPARKQSCPRPLPIAAPMRSPASSKEPANSRPHPAGRPRTGAGGRCQSLDTGRRRCAGRVEQRGVSLSLQDQTRFVRDTDRRDDPGVRRGTSQSRAQVCRRSDPGCRARWKRCTTTRCRRWAQRCSRQLRKIQHFSTHCASGTACSTNACVDPRVAPRPRHSSCWH